VTSVRAVILLLLAGLASCRTPAAPVAPAGATAPAASTSPPKTKFDDEHAAAVAKNPPGIHFEIRLAGASSRFFQGEPIPIELAFSSNLPRTYQLDGALYDRSGRLEVDKYVLDPDDGPDPLADYFDGGLRLGGGLRQSPVLGAEPHRMTFTLNEWKRFDKPGRHRLFVWSTRVRTDDLDAHDVLRVTSNVIEFEVVRASAEQERQALSDAIALLDSGRQGDHERGASALRFLSTEAAALEMIKRLTVEDRYEADFGAGLIGSQHRPAILRAMMARLVDDSPITRAFVLTVALLADKSERASVPGVSSDYARRMAMMDTYAARLADALAKKPRASRATCVETVLEIALGRQGALPPYAATALALLPSVFGELPPQLRSRLLDTRLADMNAPAMLKLIRDFYDDPATPPEERDVALRRLLELDPAGARTRILSHLRTGEPPLGVNASRELGVLAEATIPELDGPLADRLERATTPEVARMIARYATRAPLDRVKAVYGRINESWPQVVGPLLGYFLRVDPPFGAQAAKDTVVARGSQAIEALVIAADVRTTPELEKLLVAKLDDGSDDTAAQAARALSKHGSASIAALALWKRLERFHAAWKDRAEELRYSFLNRGNLEARSLEIALRSAISTAPGWHCDAACFRRLATLLMTAEEKENAELDARAIVGPITLSVGRMTLNQLNVAVAQYNLDSLAALEAKLAQFPRGTAFVVRAWEASPADLTRVTRLIERRGMSVLVEPRGTHAQ
jgi:hypothetical protein